MEQVDDNQEDKPNQKQSTLNVKNFWHDDPSMRMTKQGDEYDSLSTINKRYSKRNYLKMLETQKHQASQLVN